MHTIGANLYDKYRDTIKTGDILAWECNTIGDKLIKAWTHSPYTHVAVAWVVGERVLILQSLPGTGVDIEPLSNNLPAILFRMPSTLSDVAISAALDTLGQPYSFLNDLRAGFGLTSSGKGFECVQYVKYLWKLNGILMDFKADTPAEMVNYLQTTLGIAGEELS